MILLSSIEHLYFMITIKIQCGCGQKYAFDVEPVNGRMTAAVACPVCGADGTAAADVVIAQTLGAPPEAVPASGARLRTVSSAVTPPPARLMPPGILADTPDTPVSPRAPVTKNIIAILIVIIVIGACILGIVSVSGSGDSRVQIVPLGHVTDSNGTKKLTVALTNQTTYTLECVAGPTKVVTAADGTSTTNFSAVERVLLEPRAGTQIAITAPGDSPSWTLTVAHRRWLSDTGVTLRELASRLHLCQLLIERKLTNVEIE